VTPEAVPLFVLRVPVRYYRRPPVIPTTIFGDSISAHRTDNLSKGEAQTFRGPSRVCVRERTDDIRGFRHHSYVPAMAAVRFMSASGTSVLVLATR
jgi:hypothetical protein